MLTYLWLSLDILIQLNHVKADKVYYTIQRNTNKCVMFHENYPRENVSYLYVIQLITKFVQSRSVKNKKACKWHKKNKRNEQIVVAVVEHPLLISGAAKQNSILIKCRMY